MKPLVNRCVAALVLVLIGFSAFGQRKVIHCGMLIDGVGNKPIQNMTIVVVEDRIREITKGLQDPTEGDILIDLSNQTVMPGLMDMHVHIEGETSPTRYSEGFRMNEADVALRATIYAERTLLAGFTTVRDLGGSGVNIALRNAIKNGYVIGPNIITAGKAIGTTGGHADPTNGLRKDLMGDPGPDQGVINGPVDARKAVRQRYKNGADFVKITATGGVLSVAKDGSGPQFTSEEIAAIVSTAKEYGMISAAHAHGAEGMKRAVEAGITSIEHGTMMTEEIMTLMKQKGTFYVPTISAGRYVMEQAKIEGYYPEVIVPKALAIGPMIQGTFAAAYRAGVKIAFGTDAGVFPHGQNGKEFGYMVEGGMPAMETIKAATIVAAQMLGIENDYGTLAVGKKADIVAVSDNPLNNIATMEAVTFVMKDGKVFKGL